EDSLLDGDSRRPCRRRRSHGHPGQRPDARFRSGTAARPTGLGGALDGPDAGGLAPGLLRKADAEGSDPSRRVAGAVRHRRRAPQLTGRGMGQDLTLSPRSARKMDLVTAKISEPSATVTPNDRR